VHIIQYFEASLGWKRSRGFIYTGGERYEAKIRGDNVIHHHIWDDIRELLRLQDDRQGRSKLARGDQCRPVQLFHQELLRDKRWSAGPLRFSDQQYFPRRKSKNNERLHQF